MTYLLASVRLWELWGLSWIAAALWSRRTVGRPSLPSSIAYTVPTFVGAGLLFFGGAAARGDYGGVDFAASRPWTSTLASWTLPDAVGWAATAAVAAGLAFTWWARLTLGDLWSGTVTRKENHTIVRTGPYGLVRHPIYTGIIFSAFALAFQLGAWGNLAGAVLLTFGCWIKARLEERFLSEQLGPPYADYRAGTPMLIPFWPTAGQG